ncbi:MAG TPA: hypothetical protein VJ772_01005 [Nitrososphaeraceae archaeon]|nr:hypothetical protein [Nitrososphaeraceae archaeon]
MVAVGKKSVLEIVLALAVILAFTPILFVYGSVGCTNWADLDDNDCDGLADDWELNGYHVDTDGIVDLTFPDANKDRKDIYVELDYMKDNGTNRDHTPRAGVVQAVIDAFNAAPVSNPGGQPNGINLHIFVNEQIPHQDSITMWSGFDNLKNDWFGENDLERSKPFTMVAKDNTYHYVIFGHKYDGGTSSGRAEIPGDDFVVTLGASIWGDLNGHDVGSVDQQQGTLMHELGHNLNLRHGGNVDENCKSNYLSVMNYMFQFSNYVSDRNLDYSRSQLDPLDENALHEPTGISPKADPIDQRSNWGLNGIPRGPTTYLTALINPVDWNKSGSTSGTKSLNINNLGASSGCTSTLLTPLTGFDDWENLMFWGVTAGHGNGTIVSNGTGTGNGSSINQAAGLTNYTDVREGVRIGLDEYDAENLVSSRHHLLESIIVEVDSTPDEDFSNSTSKATLLKNMRTIQEGFSSNSTDLLPSITGLTDISNQLNSTVINPNTQKLLDSQLDNFVVALQKQQ